jgi:Rrf2 family transcriptional repressor of oqxAB
MQTGQHVQSGSVNPSWFVVALQILLLIERSGSGKVCSSGELAEQLHSHAVFLRRVFSYLVRAGIAEAREGRDGGYLLARPAEQITLADVYRALQSTGSGPVTPFELPRGLTLEPDLCAAFGDIGIEIESAILKTLERYTLADLVQRAQVSHLS